jgi:VCBS repeat-containing protein
MAGLLSNQGYYTTDDGRKIVIVEEYYADRATGEMFKTGIPIQLADDVPLLQSQWFGLGHDADAISLGRIDLNAAAPIATPDLASSPMGKSVVIDVLANDVDPNGLRMTIDGVTQPAHGTVKENSDGTLTYSPDSDFSGTETFKYWATDHNGKFSGQTVTVKVGLDGGSPPVVPAGDVPPASESPSVIAGVDVQNLTETNAVLTTSGALTISDIDSPATFVAQSNVEGAGGYGKFSIDASGNWTYATDRAHNEFVGGTTYTDTLTVASADGTTHVLTENILGTYEQHHNDGTATFKGLAIPQSPTSSLDQGAPGIKGFEHSVHTGNFGTQTATGQIGSEPGAAQPVLAESIGDHLAWSPGFVAGIGGPRPTSSVLDFHNPSLAISEGSPLFDNAHSSFVFKNLDEKDLSGATQTVPNDLLHTPTDVEHHSLIASGFIFG